MRILQRLRRNTVFRIIHPPKDIGLNISPTRMECHDSEEELQCVDMPGTSYTISKFHIL